MYDFKRLLVCLDQSDLDRSLIKAAAEYATFGKADNIYFVTVVKTLQLPDEVKNKLPELDNPMDESIEANMKTNIKNEFEGLSCDFHFDVLEGDPTHQIIRWSQVKEIDLIILGKKQYHIGKGVVSRNIVNIVHCSALFVTANSRIKPKSILVATDFSKASHLAYQKAVKIANIVEASMTCIHSYEIPTAFHATGSTYEEFEKVMRDYSKDEYDRFIGEEDIAAIDEKVEFLVDKHGNPDRLIAGYASLHHFDLVVIGSKGRTSLSSVLLGSVAAKIVESDLDIPILVIKAKEDNLKLVDAILQL